MSKRVIAVLACAVVALVVATLWVPVQRVDARPSLANAYAPVRAWAWAVAGPHTDERHVLIAGDQANRAGPTYAPMPFQYRVRWRPFLSQILIALAVGGLLAMALYTRDRRQLAAAQ